jgi:hypothetical protein
MLILPGKGTPFQQHLLFQERFFCFSLSGFANDRNS